MTPELEQKLYERWPEIFEGRFLPPTQSLMCFGLECGDGWFDLIDALCSQLANHYSNAARAWERRLKNATPDENGMVEVPLVPRLPRAVQVKEKFGGLRFYVDSATDEDYACIHMAEAMSYRICETCGNPGENKNDHNWWSTVCDSCSALRGSGILPIKPTSDPEVIRRLLGGERPEVGVFSRGTVDFVHAMLYTEDTKEAVWRWAGECDPPEGENDLIAMLWLDCPDEMMFESTDRLLKQNYRLVGLKSVGQA